MAKTPAMESFLENMCQQTFGRSRKECLEMKLCVNCGGPANKFKNVVSAGEYTLSVSCQNCQDKTFG